MSGSGTSGAAAVTRIASYGAERPPTESSVHDLDADVFDAESVESRFGIAGQRRDPFDGEDKTSQSSEHRRLVARSGPDLENPIIRPDLRRLGHGRHHPRLRDGLPFTDVDGHILRIGRVAVRLGDKEIPRDQPHGVEDPSITDPEALQCLDHLHPPIGVAVVGRSSAAAGSPLG